MSRLDEILDKIRAQLPGFHVPDSVAGGLVGAGGGYLYHRYKQRNATPEQDRSELASLRLRSRLLRGALGGAFAGNLVGDRARRLLSNSPTMAGYDAGQVVQGLKREGMRGLYTGAIKDEPLPMRPGDHFYDETKGNKWNDAPLMRRELLRRGLGVQSESPTNWFQNAGSIVGADGRAYPKIELHKRFYDNAAGILDPKHKNIWTDLWGDKGGYGITADADKTTALRMSDVFAGFPTENYGKVRRLTDYWDFDLGPAERSIGSKLLASVVKNPLQWNAGLPSAEISEQLLRRDDGSGTVGQALTSLGLRKVFNDVLATKAPVFDQFAVMPGKTDAVQSPRMLSSVRSITQGGPDRDHLINLVNLSRLSGTVDPIANIYDKARNAEMADIGKWTSLISGSNQ